MQKAFWMIGKERRMKKPVKNGKNRKPKRAAKKAAASGNRTAGLLSAVIILAVLIFGIYTLWLRPSNSRKVIVLDPVHGMDDYALKGLVNEDAFSRQLCDEISTQLKATGRYEVVETHDADTMMSVKERAEVVNDSNGDLLISIGCWDSSYMSVTGPQIFADQPSSRTNKDSVSFANDLNQAFQDAGIGSSVSYFYYHPLANGRSSEHIVDVSDATDYGEETFALLEQSEVPGVVVRQIDVNSQSDVDAYMSEEGCQKLASYYVKAIDAYFGVDNG